MQFFTELKRRNVLRVAAAYIVTAWLIIQVAETLLPVFGFGDTPIRVIVILLAIGVVPVLVFAWAFELTPEGLKKEKDIDRSQSIAPQTGKKLDRMIMLVLALALGYFAFDKFVLDPQRDAALREQQAEQLAIVAEEARQEGRSEAIVDAYGDKSIAVLAFEDMSPDKDQEYMSDGIAEELLNLLAKVRELRVISRSSSFRYKGKDISLSQISKELDVAHILEGSVRKAGNQVRITAQLIDARTDTHLWSETYDRTLDDIFAIQDDISATVVDQLKVTLLGEKPHAQKVDPEAYALYLHARHLSRQHTIEAFQQSIELSDQAIAIDPDFVSPWASKSTVYINMAGNGMMPRDEALALSRLAAQRALALNPASGEALGVRAWDAMVFEQDLALAADYYQRALAAEPTNISIISNAATLVLYLGRYEDAIALREFATSRNPLSAVAHFNFGAVYLSAGRLQDAEKELRTTLRLSPGFWPGHMWLGKVILLQGDAQAALDMTQQGQDEAHRLIGQALCYFALGERDKSDAALSELIADHEASWTYDIASIYAYRNQPEEAFAWLDKAATNNDPALAEPPYNLFFTKIKDDPRWEQFLERIGKSQAQLDAIEFEFKPPRDAGPA